jgi:hypothetical protein
LSTSGENARSQTAEPSARIRSGSLAESIYTSTYFGFTFTFPKGWIVVSGPEDKDCQSGCPLLGVRAPDYPDGGKIIVSVDEVGRMPTGTSGRDYLDLLHSSTVRTGGKALTDLIETTRQGRTFYRRDYYVDVKGIGRGWYQSLVVITLKKSAIWFMITAGSQQKLTKLLQTLDSIRFASQ